MSNPVAATFCYDYPRPALSADIVLLHWQKTLSILLIQRKNPPFALQWALPGGFVDAGENVRAAAHRELAEETGLDVKNLTLFGEFSDPNRDPRTRVISLGFTALLATLPPVQGQDDAQEAGLVPVQSLPALAFDHREILRQGLEFWQQQLCALPHSVGLFPHTWPLKKLQQLANDFHSYPKTL